MKQDSNSPSASLPVRGFSPGFAALGRGNGGFWEDRGYDWYAGI